ncbi:MAG: OadG family protein [Firmicutes bacterium]|nr:OadG family protein [Bacillota bacterium]
MASLKLGIFTTLMGMGGIFLVLIILSLVTMLAARLIDKSRQPHENSAHQEAAVKAVPMAPAPAAAIPAADGGLSPKTVAAIMGAISAASGGAAFKIMSIHRIGSINTPWTSASNGNIINNRQQYL